MESEECAPAAAVPPPPPPLSQQNPNPGRNRKRGGSGLMSSTVEAQVASHLPHHHDKVLRSHTRRGRGAGPVPPVVVPPPISISTSGGGISRRKQRSSCCSSFTDEDDGGGSGGGEYGEVSVSLLNFGEERGKVEVSEASENTSSSIITTTTISNSNKVVIERRAGGEQVVIIPSSTSCFAPTNETKELCEQAGLLGGPTKTTTIHSGGTRLSSLCIPPHNDLATQQCRNNNAGEHSSNSNNSNDNVKNSSQKIAQGIAATAADNSAPHSRRRSRQHGHHHREQSTPPASAAADDADDDAQGNNVRRGSRGESGDDDNDEMRGEDAASRELPGKPNTATPQIQSSSPLTLSSSSVVVGASLSSAVTTSGGAETQVKSERGENGGKDKEGKNLTPNKRGAKEQLKQYITEREEQQRNCERIHVKREVGEISLNSRDLSGGGVGALKVNKIGGHDGGWSAGEDGRQAEDKDGANVEKKIFSSTSSSPSWSSVASSGCVSMPQKAGVKGSIQEDGGNFGAGKEQSKQSKSGASSGGASMRCVKKCASGASKKQSASASQAFNNNNNNISSAAAQSVGKSVDRKKAPVPAPMLLMNNLPYMGELTFDTRPRRGRKPKKADICHLISKNYGIQFPAGVTQATLNASSLPIIAKSAQVSAASLSSASKKTAETVSVSSKNNVFSSPRSLVPPTFCNRDVSIVPIIPTTWGSGIGCPNSSDSSSKCSPSSSNLLKPLSSLAQQLMLHHHHQNPANSSAASTRSMATITSSTQQAISMFPLPTPSSFSQSHHTGNVSRANNSSSKRSKTCDREADYNAGEDEEENMMEVDIESHGGGDGDDEDNQDSPLNLCMRDKSMLLSHHHRPHEPLSLIKEESLDVRWNRSGSGGKGSGASRGVVRTSGNNISVNSYSSDGATREGGSSKRSMMQGSSANPMMKGGKSAKIAGTTSRPPSSLNFSLVNSNTSNNISVCDSDSVSNLVSCRPSPSPSSSPFGSVQQSSKLSPNIFAISAHHLQPQGLENTGKAGGGGKGKQGTQSRKKREVNLRGDISISAAGSPGSSGTPTPLSSIGGTLFGQSTAGINDGAEVSICKFKFTGGAKPCLQEKKMLSVDSGGNFRFYSDKTTGAGGGSGAGATGKLSGKGQQQLPLSSASGCSNNVYSTTGRTDMSQSPPSTGDGIECHYALSSLPKSAKSMSMCMPQGAVSNSGVQVQMSSSTTTSAASSKGKGSSASKLSLPLTAASSSSGAAANPYASLSISPTAEELQQLHLSMQDQVQQSRSSSRVSPFPSGGDYSYSSSNSCSSSDNCFGGDAPSSSSVKSSRQTSSSHSHNYRGSGSSSGKMKLKRKRRTRKSLMREKLEKTFKEKGFLIQTQQLESAEGATYCKFRQLRKFTRYLFRSWKDYLPDHVKEISDNNANNNNDGAIPGSGQELPNSHQASDSTGQKGESSNVQSIADEEAEGDVDDEEDDGDEDYELDSEEHLRQSLISHGNAIANDDEDDDSDEDEVDDEERATQQREVFKGSNLKRKDKPSSAVRVATASATEVQKLDEADSSKDDDNDDLELQVDS